MTTELVMKIVWVKVTHISGVSYFVPVTIPPDCTLPNSYEAADTTPNTMSLRPVDNGTVNPDERPPDTPVECWHDKW